MTPASIIPVFGSQRPYADLNFAGGSFGLDGRTVSDLTALPGFTFTRASLAMGYDATGKLVYGPNNLLLQSQTLDNASWTKTNSVVTADAGVAPDGTTTADKIVVNNGAAAGRVQQVLSAIAGTRYLLSAYVKPSGWNWFALRVAEDSAAAVYFDVGTGAVGAVESGWSSASITSAGNGWYRVAAVYTALVGSYTWRFLPTNANSAFTTGDGVNGSLAWGLQVEAVTYQTTPSTYYPTTTAAYYGPRFVYDPVTLASQGILVEEARTNSCLQSSTFSTTWSAVVSNVTANSTTAPDGTLTADTLVPTAVLQQHRLDQTTTITAAAHNASVYAKAAGYGFLWMRLGTLGGVFNLSTGAITSLSGGATGVATDVGNGWWRCALQGTTAGSDVYRLAATPTASTADYTGDGTSGIYLWGAQIELGVGASSPIPTTTAAVTRAADVAAVTGLAASYPLTMTADFTRNWDAGAAQIVAQVDAGSDAQRSYVSIDASDLLAGITSGSGSSTVAGATVVGTAYKGAARIATDDLQTARGGTLGTADTSATNPTNPTRLVIGGANAAGSPVNGTISRIRIYNRALPDAQLQSLTT